MGSVHRLPHDQIRQQQRATVTSVRVWQNEPEPISDMLERLERGQQHGLQ